MKRHILSIRTIIHSVIATLLIMTLLMGFVVVEKNTRKIGFAESKPWLIYKDSTDEGHYLKIRFMDEFYTLDFSCVYTVTDVISQFILQN